MDIQFGNGITATGIPIRQWDGMGIRIQKPIPTDLCTVLLSRGRGLGQATSRAVNSVVQIIILCVFEAAAVTAVYSVQSVRVDRLTYNLCYPRIHGSGPL